MGVRDPKKSALKGINKIDPNLPIGIALFAHGPKRGGVKPKSREI